MSKRSRSKSSRSGTRPRARTRVVQAWDGGELLQHIPELVAVDTSDSLVVVAFGRGQVKRYRSLGAMRVDLLHTDDELQLQRWAAEVLTTVLRVQDVIGVALIAYTPETFEPSGRPPAAQQLRAATRQAEKTGLDIVDRFCVAADGWGSLGDPELPRGGRPLSEIEPAPGGDQDEPQRIRPRGAAEITMAPEAARAAFARHYDAWWSRSDGPGGTLHGVRLAQPGSSFGITSATEAAMERYRWGRDDAQVVALVEAMLDPHEHDAAPCPCRALLLALAERQGIENLVLVQFAWGRRFADEVWAAANAGDPASKSVARLTAAISGGAFRRPDTERIDRAVEVLLEVATYVPPLDRAPIDGMLAWLHWACGGGSAAGAYARRALAVQPGRDIPTLVLVKAQRTELPQWAFRKNAHKPDPFAVPA